MIDLLGDTLEVLVVLIQRVQALVDLLQFIAEREEAAFRRGTQ